MGTRRINSLGLFVITILSMTPVRAQQLYWDQSATSQSRIGKINLDGTGIATLTLTNIFSHPSNGIDASASLGQIFFYHGDANAIRRTDLSFSGLTTVVPGAITPGEGAISNVATDAAAHKLFYISWIVGFTGVAEYDLNTNSSNGGADLQVNGNVTDFSADLAVDPLASVVYCTRNNGDIVPVHYSDFGLQGQFNPVPILSVGSAVSGIALDLPAGKMYLAARDLHQILRANLDGTGLETLLTLASTDTPMGMDLFGGRMYWADQAEGRIESASINGSDLHTLISGLNNPTAVSIVPEPVFSSLIGLTIIFLRRNQ